MRLSTDELANQIKQVQADMDKDLKDTKDFIKNLRDFLSGGFYFILAYYTL